MRKFVCLGLAITGAHFALACSPAPVRPTGPEVLLPGEFIESVDANVILAKCTGKGGDQMSAIYQARKACVEWVVNDQLAQTPGEKQAYKQAQPQVFAQLDKYVGQPGPGSADQKGKGVKSQFRLDEYTVQVTIIIDVNKRFLTDDLVAMGVIKSKSEVLEAVGTPTMIVQPSKASQKNKYRKLVEDLVNSYLTKNKLEVLDAGNVEDLNKLVGAIGEVAGAEEDEIAKLAQAIGADVYVVFEIKIDKKANGSVAYGVGMSAFETTTSRKLGSEMVIGPARANWVAGEEMKAFADPVNDAMGKIVPQIFDYWKEDIPKGNRFTIVIKNAPKNCDMKLGSWLKKSCAFVKTDLAGKTVKFHAQCKGDNMEIANSLDEGIKASFNGADYDFLAKNKNSIIVLFMHRAFLQGRRKETRFPHYELDQVDSELPIHSPEQVSRVDSAEAVEMLAKVDDVFRGPLALFYLQDCPYKEIALIFNVPLGTVKSRIARGIAQLQRLLTPAAYSTQRVAA